MIYLTTKQLWIMPKDWPLVYRLMVVVVIVVTLGGSCSTSITTADMSRPQGEAITSPHSQSPVRVTTLAAVLTPSPTPTLPLPQPGPAAAVLTPSPTPTLPLPLPGPAAAVLTMVPLPGTVVSGTAQPTSTPSSEVPSKPKTLPSLSDLNLWHYLPRAWSSMCTIDYNTDPDVNVTINCRIPPSKDIQWRLADLRTALSPIETALKLQVAVSLRCDEDGTISLPFPFRCPALVKLSVSKCLMADKYADFMTPAQELPDWLKWQEIRNCTWLVTNEETELLLKNQDKVTSHYDCGQDSTLITYMYSNIRDQYLPRFGDNKDLGDFNMWQDQHSSMTTAGPEEKERAGVEDGFKTILIMDNMTTHCFFEHLEVHDESYPQISSLSHMEFFAKNSRFPKLRLLNVTAFGFREVPLEVREARRRIRDSQLGVIDLSHNNVSQVGFIPAYPSNLNLTLILRHNNISVISYKMFEEWATVPNLYVDIRDNPISCDCNLKPLISAIANTSLWESRAKAYYLNQLSVITCATPSELKGRAVTSLGVSELPCPIYRADLTPAMAGLAVIVVVLLISLVFAIRYRKEARILIYTRMHIVLPCGLPARSGPAAEKQYDAFVAYAHQDSDWVLNSLMKRLEEPAGGRGIKACKLCIHQRDFVVGKPIIDNIIDCIAASRHTIIVLSKHFVKSSWAMEELQHAYRQSLEERRCHLVLVVLDEVPQGEMTPILRRCTKTFTYIHVNDMLFWDRLLYSIHMGELTQNKRLKKGAEDGDLTPDIMQLDPANNNQAMTPPLKGEVIDNQALTPQVEGKGADMETENRFDAEFRRAVFLEAMRTTSVDTVCSTLSDTHIPPTPSHMQADRPLFAITH